MPTLKTDLTSKKRFTPEAGPVTGLLVGMDTNKEGHPKVLTVETVRGTFKARVAKSLRAPLGSELELRMALRLWVKVKGDKIMAQLVVPLQARQVVEGTCREARQTCIWVCTSKSCCRRGGSEVLERLRDAIAPEDQARIQIKKCGCLGTCKKGPSLKIRGDKKIHQVDPCSVPQLLERVLHSN